MTHAARTAEVLSRFPRISYFEAEMIAFDDEAAETGVFDD